MAPSVGADHSRDLGCELYELYTGDGPRDRSVQTGNWEDPQAVMESTGFQEGQPLFECIRGKIPSEMETARSGLPWFKQKWRLRVTQPLKSAPTSLTMISLAQTRKPPRSLNIPLSHQLGLLGRVAQEGKRKDGLL